MKNRYLVFFVLFCFNMGMANTFLKTNYNKYLERSFLMKVSEKKIDNLRVKTFVPQMIISEIIKAAIKKVLRAMDLVFQRLQNVQLKVQTTLEQAKNVMSETKLGEVNNLVNEKRQIFDTYYQELWVIKNKMDQIKAIKQAIISQGQMIENFTVIYQKFSGDTYLNESELETIYDVYSGMMGKNVDGIEDLWVLIKDFSVKMQDGERLSLIKEKIDVIGGVTADFNGFTQDVIKLSLSRVKEAKELNEMKVYYGLEN